MTTSQFERVVLTRDLLDGWKRRDQANERAVIFVHGFMGSPEETWRAGRTERSFPELLLDDPLLGDFDVFRFKYKSNPFSGPNIRNIARQLETEILDCLAGYRIVLLAHSLGGLVCMQYIVDRLEKGELLPIIGLLMFGTPTTGVEWVNIARIVLALGGLKASVSRVFGQLLEGNRQFEELSIASQFLQDLQASWNLRVVNGGFPEEPANRRAWVPVRVVTGNEDWVVREISARGIYGQIDWQPVQADHRSLVKPTSHKDVCYKRASEFLSRCRHSFASDILGKLRGLSDWIWELRETKLIRDWRFEIHFLEPGRRPPGSALDLEGFSICDVKSRYTLVLREEPFVLGLTLGRDAARSAWKGNPAYLHQIYLGAMTSAEREVVSKRIQGRLAEPAAACDSLLENVTMRIAEAGTESWHDLPKDHVDCAPDRLLSYFQVPAALRHLVGREVTLDLGFRSFRPNSLTDFTLQFPWLTAGFDALVIIHGKTEYLVAASQFVGQTQPIVDPPEDFGDGHKIRINGDKHLALPGSSVRIEWLPA